MAHAHHLLGPRGWSRLTTEGTQAVVNLVEAVHDAVLALASLRVAAIRVPISAITRLGYRVVRLDESLDHLRGHPPPSGKLLLLAHGFCHGSGPVDAQRS